MEMEHRPYRIFVAGIPSKVKYRQVLTFFEHLGEFTHIYGLDKASKKLSPRYPLGKLVTRGCCILVTPSSKTYELITSESMNIEFMGRSLICRPFWSGQDLAVHNQRLNICRVLLKQVPSALSEQELHSLLESTCGPVQILFPLRAQKVHPSHLTPHKKQYTYSVTFQEDATAEKLKAQGYLITASGDKILASPHIYLPKKSPNKLGDSSVQLSQHHQMVPRLRDAYTSREIQQHFTKPTNTSYFHSRSLFSQNNPTPPFYCHNRTNIQINVHYSHIRPCPRSVEKLFTRKTLPA